MSKAAQIESSDGLAHTVRNGGHQAAIFVEAENGYRKGEPGKRIYTIFHLKVVSTLGCYEGSFSAEPRDDWREVINGLSASETLDILAQNSDARDKKQEAAFLETLWTPFCKAMQPAPEPENEPTLAPM